MKYNKLSNLISQIRPSSRLGNRGVAYFVGSWFENGSAMRAEIKVPFPEQRSHFAKQDLADFLLADGT
jgi:hypothetical protein